MHYHTLDQAISYIIKFQYRKYKENGFMVVPLATYNMARMEALSRIFLAIGTGFEWVKDSDGLYRRILHNEKIHKIKNPSQYYYKKHVNIYFSDEYVTNKMARLYTLMQLQFDSILSTGKVEPGFSLNPLPLDSKLDLYLHSPLVLETRDGSLVDPKQIHPESKQGLKEIVGYVLSLEDPLKDVKQGYKLEEVIPTLQRLQVELCAD
jgi:hypothetical protein